MDLTADEARRVILRAQGFVGADARRGGVPTMLRRLGAVQLDTISVLARSHELVAYARLGAVGRPTIERAYWDSPAQSFEYWCHAACILPIEHWPLYEFRRRAYRERRQRWHKVPDNVDKLLQQVRDSGPLTTSDVGGAKNGGPWWDWSDSKIGLEWLLDIGEVVCSRRVGWRRTYDLAERVVPADLLAQDLTDEECVARLAAIAGRSLGVATRSDLIDFLRLQGRFTALLDEALLSGAAGLVPVRVSGWPNPRRTSTPTGVEPALISTATPSAADLNTASPSTADPSSVDPSSATLSTTTPGTTEPGTASPSTVRPGMTGSGTASSSTVRPGMTGSGSDDPGTASASVAGSGRARSGSGSLGAGPANAWADPAALESEPRGRHRTTLISPFDSLIWHRGRTERIFGFNYQLELYVPKHKRVHGYFTMPVLAGGRLIGRIDPAREGTTLVARQLSLEPGLTSTKWVDALRDALWSAAEWVGCDSVRVDRTDPPELAKLLSEPPA
ncbi:winged helix-turn-helix domain-containing protein [Nonomuraea glycinis]|uniref:winged helix-turn-helix domain-containing protein n=1 Tax=Nonomuraea glycinis TaxID=2047744 RepID=UPI002E0E1AA1|nr:winged helix DNA-binding domain-containing protein [Nonomuraea glycinis]